jgi:peptide/nickel transport system substrate-binding protein
MAIDRKAMSETLYAGVGQGGYRYQWFALGLTDPPTLEDMMASSPWMDYQPAKARSLLAEAGFPNGLELEFMVSGSPTNEHIIVQQYFDQIGVKLAFNQVESVVNTQAQLNRSFKHMIASAGISSFEVSGSARGFWLPDAPTNVGGISDLVMTDLVEKITYSLDADEQVRLVQQLNTRDLEQQYHLIFPNFLQLFVWHPWLHNMANAPSGNFQIFSHYQYGNAWVDDTAPEGRQGRLRHSTHSRP